MNAAFAIIGFALGLYFGILIGYKRGHNAVVDAEYYSRANELLKFCSMCWQKYFTDRNQRSTADQIGRWFGENTAEAIDEIIADKSKLRRIARKGKT